MKKKKYRLREGSLAWHVVRNKTAIATLATVTAIMLMFSAASALAKTTDLSEEKAEDGQVIETAVKQAETSEKAPKTYDVPLDAGLENHIITLCDRENIDPALVMAVIGVESNYNAEAIGDNGRSYGLMQVQTEWHQARIERLKSPDMLNPYDNVTVGIDILAEKISKDKGIEWALMAYNGGNSHADMMQQTGQLSEYAETVIKLWQELKGGAA